MKRSYIKLFAGVLTVATLMNSMTPAFLLNSMAAAPRGEGSGTGTIEGVLSDVFDVIVPTQPVQGANNVSDKSIYDFILDPRGWAQTGSLSAAGLKLEPNASVYFKNQSGSFDYSSTSDALTITNRSTTKVDVTLKAQLTGMEGIKLTGDNTFANGTDPSACVYFALIDSNGKKSYLDKYGAFLKATMEGRPEAYNKIYDSVTKKYKYELKSDADLAAGNIVFPEYSFRLTGVCNGVDSWSRVPSIQNTKMEVTWVVSLRPKSVAPSIGKTSYVMNKGIPLPIEVDLGAGKLAAKGIKSITGQNLSGTAGILAASEYTFANGTLTLSASYIAGLIDKGITSHTLKVVFDDIANTSVKILLTINDEIPSIAQSEYSMSAGQRIDMDIDWGTGDLAASGIQSIQYVNDSGNVVTVSTNGYWVDGDTLIFRASYVKQMISDGSMSREFTITFNNKVKTQTKVLVTAEGTIPSIAQNEYIMQKGNDVVVNVDPGTGSLQANGIESIKYVNASGETIVVPTEKYEFVGNSLKFKAFYVTAMINSGNASRSFTITFNNAVKTQVEVILKADDVAPVLNQNTYDMISAQPVLIDIDWGSGALGATGVQSITYEETPGAIVTVTADRYACADGELRFRGSYITSILGEGCLSRTFTITLNDTASTQMEVTLRATGNVPSIAQSLYNMNTGTPVAVNVNLGSGALAATGIGSIEYVDAAGKNITVTSDKYWFDGNTLTFRGSYITALLNEGTVSRSFIITFNNATKTQTNITLTATGNAPSIAQTSYDMKKNNSVSIGISWGTDGLKATGIKNIVYKNTSGAVTTVPTERYWLNGNELVFRGSYISQMIDGGYMSRTFTITFNDPASTQVDVTLTAPDIAPSIDNNKVYTMTTGQPLLLDLSLGSGNMMATGIKSVTYKEGTKTITVPTSYYLLEGETLRIRASYINGVLSAGVMSRDYVVTFNDKQNTSVTITLKK